MITKNNFITTLADMSQRLAIALQAVLSFSDDDQWRQHAEAVLSDYRAMLDEMEQFLMVWRDSE